MKIDNNKLKKLVKEIILEAYKRNPAEYGEPKLDIEDLDGPRRANRYGEPRRGVAQTSAVTDRSKIDSPKKQIHSVGDITPYQALATKALEGPPKIFDNRALERLFHAARSGRDQNAQAMLDAVIEQRPEIGRDVEFHLKMMRIGGRGLATGLSPAEIDAFDDDYEDINEGHKSVKITKAQLKSILKEALQSNTFAALLEQNKLDQMKLQYRTTPPVEMPPKQSKTPVLNPVDPVMPSNREDPNLTKMRSLSSRERRVKSEKAKLNAEKKDLIAQLIPGSLDPDQDDIEKKIRDIDFRLIELGKLEQQMSKVLKKTAFQDLSRDLTKLEE